MYVVSLGVKELYRVYNSTFLCLKLSNRVVAANLLLSSPFNHLDRVAKFTPLCLDQGRFH